MQTSKTVDQVKAAFGVRLSFIIRNLSREFTTLQLAKSLEISTGTLYKIKNDLHEKVSVNMLIEVAERLGLKYKAVIEFNGKKRNVTITGIETASGIQYGGTLHKGRIQLSRIA